MYPTLQECKFLYLKPWRRIQHQIFVLFNQGTPDSYSCHYHATPNQAKRSKLWSPHPQLKRLDDNLRTS